MEAQQINIEPINNDYEFIQYNSQLRLIHSIKDDMYQAQSIVTACKSNKQIRHWINNESSREIIQELAKILSGNFLPDEISDDLEGIYENRPNLSISLRGIYVHRLLVNHIAIWASSKYALYIMKLLDSTFEDERNRLANKIEEQQPRLVPTNHKHDYFYLCWKQELDDEYVILHQVRRQTKTFNRVKSHYDNQNEMFYYRTNLPISMSPANEIKQRIRKIFAGSDYKIRNYDIIIKKSCLDTLHDIITSYFESFQQ